MKNGSNINIGNNKLKEADYVYYNFFLGKCGRWNYRLANETWNMKRS